jgi:hypothetical protein
VLAFKNRVEVAERMTAEEFFCNAPETRKAELIDGVMIMAPPPLDIIAWLWPDDRFIPVRRALARIEQSPA